MSFNPWDIGGPLFERTAARVLGHVAERAAGGSPFAEQLDELTARVLGGRQDLYPHPGKLSLVNSTYDNVLAHLLKGMEYTANTTSDGLFYIQDYFDLAGTDHLRRLDGAYRYGFIVDRNNNFVDANARLPDKWGYGFTINGFNIRYWEDVPFSVGNLLTINQILTYVPPEIVRTDSEGNVDFGNPVINTEGCDVKRVHAYGSFLSASTYQEDAFIYLGYANRLESMPTNPQDLTRSEETAPRRLVAGLRHLLELAHTRNPHVLRGRGYPFRVEAIASAPISFLYD